MSEGFNKYEALLITWCDKLIEYQVPKKFDKSVAGGFLCPACTYIHGRSADAIYPLMTAAKITGEKKYINSAKAVFDWSETSMRMNDGSIRNDTFNDWRGISAFYAFSLLDALHHHSDLLDKKTILKWTARIRELVDFCGPYITSAQTAVNYKVALPALYAYAGSFLKDEAYMLKAKEYRRNILDHLTDDDLLFGEPKYGDYISKKGCRRIDLGYNAEESIGLILTYCEFMPDDTEMLEIVKKLTARLKIFYLPDGALDNSFGARMAKWSYWGSRTSDGCQPLFFGLQDEDPEYMEISERNLELYEKCTVDGLLSGGTMYKSAGEPPCTHHSFCHAKVIAHLIDKGYTPLKSRIKLKSESEDFYEYFKSLHISLIRKGAFRATISDYDAEMSLNNSYSSGGSLTLLYHNKVGPIFAASMPEYHLVEPTNMQYSKFTKELCQTPRLEFEKDGVIYSTTNARRAKVTKIADGIFKVTGKLTSPRFKELHPYTASYIINKDKVEIEYSTSRGGTLYLPIIASSLDEVKHKETNICVVREGGKVNVKATKPLKNALGEIHRNFNHCGGFETYVASCTLAPREKIKIEITVK